MATLGIAEIVEGLADGEVVFLAGASGEAVEFTAELARPGRRIADAHFLATFVPGINTPAYLRSAECPRTTVFFMQRAYEAAAAAGRVDCKRMNYFRIQQFLTDPNERIDTAIVQVSAPNEDGMCSLGPAVEFMPAVLGRCRRAIGILNSQVPFLPGSIAIPVHRFEHIAHSAAPLATYAVPPGAKATSPLVTHLAALIPDGATVQIGVGKIPSQLLEALGNHRELALHSGMISDAALSLARCGALRAHKPIVTGVAVGTPEFYRTLPDFGEIQFAEVAYTHNPVTLAGIARLYAVNAALEIDLLGQINSEMVDGHFISGPGGLPDFARGAHLSASGMSIIALNAADSTGAKSRIVAQLPAGAPVTVPPDYVDAVVTEYGVAHLRGQSSRERALRLCGIAHPDHRDSLSAAARDL